MYIYMDQNIYLYEVVFSPGRMDQLDNLYISFIIYSLCNIILDYFIFNIYARVFVFSKLLYKKYYSRFVGINKFIAPYQKMLNIFLQSE